MNQPRIDYSARDYASIKQALINFINARFPNEITDFSEASLAVAMVEFNAYVGDMLSFMIDRVANETFLSTATERPNIVAIAKMLGYQVKPATAASGELSINLAQAHSRPLLITAGTQIVVGDVTYEVLEDYTLPSGVSEAGPGTAREDLPGVPIGEGVSYAETFIGNGNPFQRFTTINNRVIRDSVEVFVDGIQWFPVDSLVFAQDTTEYALEFTADERAVIQFGDNLTGLAPFDGQEIQVLFRSGGGVAGNAAAGFIDTTVNGVLDDATQVTVPVINNTPVSGGTDPESIESIKFNAPRHLKTHGNAITQEDWDTLARQFFDPSVGAVANAVVVPRLGKTNSGANEVDVYIWARGVDNQLTSTSQALKDAVKDYLAERAIWNIDTFVHDGNLKSIDVIARVQVDTRQTDVMNIDNEIKLRIQDFFNRSSILPGDTFRVSELYEEVQAISGVLYSNLEQLSPVQDQPNIPLTDVATEATEIYILGNLTLHITVQGQTGREEVVLPNL